MIVQTTDPVVQAHDDVRQLCEEINHAFQTMNLTAYEATIYVSGRHKLTQSRIDKLYVLYLAWLDDND